AYLVTCTDVLKDSDGRVVELRCRYDPETRSGSGQAGRRVKGTLHWVSADRAQPAEVRLYESLMTKANPGDEDQGGDYRAWLNPASLQVLTECLVEPSLAGAHPGQRFQFERQGYFCVDADSSEEKLVFNRTVSLRDSWAKIEKAQKPG
ncbi:MAG: glutamine--tRNA ligase, partial [Nitrospirales bacterium]|nr:glutamine--tRNA ligase [Nitrospirales bacterium]